MKIELHSSITFVVSAISQMGKTLKDDNNILTAAINEASTSLDRFEKAARTAETIEISKRFREILGLAEAYLSLQMKLDLALRACEHIIALMGEEVPIVD